METSLLGTSNIPITKIVMGTWQTGKSMWTGIEDQESIKALQAAYDAGITSFDTAEIYGNGHSEQIIGKALGHLRQKITIFSKVYANHFHHDQVIEACHRSLKHLGTDYLDLYQIHWPSGSWGTEIVPVAETMGALNQLLEQGKIRAIGVSNFSRLQMEEAAAFGPIQSLQPPYSLFWRFVEQDAGPYCREQDISILAYSPLAQGILTGKFGPDHKFDPGDHRSTNKLFRPHNYARIQQALADLRPIALEKGINLAQLSLAWLIAQPKTHAIVGARNAQQITDSAKAGLVSLSRQEWETIDRIGRRVTDHLERDPVLWTF